MQPGSYLEIRLGTHAYALPIEFVHEIDPVGDITPLPNSSPYICGLTNLRGQVVPVLDLKVRLGEAKCALTRESCVVVIEGVGGLTGLLVDGVTRVANLTGEPTLPRNCHLKDRTLVAGIAQEGEKTITILDLANVMLGMGPPKLAHPEGIVPESLQIGAQAVKLLG
jgi:purine-binding chemotaxis protein CheW